MIISRTLANTFAELFIQVAEALPIKDASVDAVIGTLVLCSVKDVDQALQGILVHAGFQY